MPKFDHMCLFMPANSRQAKSFRPLFPIYELPKPIGVVACRGSDVEDQINVPMIPGMQSDGNDFSPFYNIRSFCDKPFYIKAAEAFAVDSRGHDESFLCRLVFFLNDKEYEIPTSFRMTRDMINSLQNWPWESGLDINLEVWE